MKKNQKSQIAKKRVAKTLWAESMHSASAKSYPTWEATGTLLANKRTLLSFIRTALTVAMAGISLVNFFQRNPIFFYIGWSLVPLSILVLAMGVVQYHRTDKAVSRELRRDRNHD